MITIVCIHINDFQHYFIRIIYSFIDYYNFFLSPPYRSKIPDSTLSLISCSAYCQMVAEPS